LPFCLTDSTGPMTNTVLRFLLATAVVVACAKPDSRADSAAKTATANGTVASASIPSALPHRDTITDRADAGRILGDTNATVWVVMVSDFQCPYCKQWHDASFQQLMKAYVNSGKIRLAFLNMPLSMHPNAVPAAEAAMCASVQGKFWPLHEALFATQKQWENMANGMPVFDSVAKASGVNMLPWRTCVLEHKTLSLVQADHDRASGARINSTPAFFVGKQLLIGADADIPTAVEAALKANPSKKPRT
jgi:protein-disulfide isomerase